MKRLGRVVGVATELGLTMGLMAAGLVILGLWLGRRLDASLGTGPLATIALVIAGAAAGQVAIYRLATRSARRLSEGAGSALPRAEVISSVALGLGILALAVVPGLVGFGLGIWLDRTLGSGGLAILILGLGGMVAGFAGSLWVALSRRTRPDQGGDEAC